MMPRPRSAPYAAVIIGWILWLQSAAICAATVVEHDGVLLLNDHGQIRRLELPYSLREADSFSIKVNGQVSSDGPPSGAASGSMPLSSLMRQLATANLERPQMSSLLFQANQLFIKKRYGEAMRILDTAEAIDSRNATVKAMKWSLFYVTGQQEFARQLWQESLQIDPNQANLKQHLQSLPAEPSPEVAP